MWTHAMNATAVWWMWALMVLATVAFWVMVAVVVQLLLGRPAPPLGHGRGPHRWGRLLSPPGPRPAARGVHLVGEVDDGPGGWRGPWLAAPMALSTTHHGSRTT